jgi:hypothetical protein
MADKRHLQKPLVVSSKSRKGVGIARWMSDEVSASSITIGPSLGEKVDAADQDHTECPSLWLLPRRGSCELTAQMRGSGRWREWRQ